MSVSRKLMRGWRSLIRQQLDRPLMSGPKLGQPKLRVNVWLGRLWGQNVGGSEMNRIRTQDVVVVNHGADYVEILLKMCSLVFPLRLFLSYSFNYSLFQVVLRIL